MGLTLADIMKSRMHHHRARLVCTDEEPTRTEFRSKMVELADLAKTLASHHMLREDVAKELEALVPKDELLAPFQVYRWFKSQPRSIQDWGKEAKFIRSVVIAGTPTYAELPEIRMIVIGPRQLSHEEMMAVDYMVSEEIASPKSLFHDGLSESAEFTEAQLAEAMEKRLS